METRQEEEFPVRWHEHIGSSFDALVEARFRREEERLVEGHAPRKTRSASRKRGRRLRMPTGRSSTSTGRIRQLEELL
jgi:hypothetical protein